MVQRILIYITAAGTLANSIAILIVLFSSSAEDADIQRVLGAIQDSRRETITRSCRETNERYANAIKVIDTVSAEDPQRDSARARRGRRVTNSILSAILPQNPDCEARARMLVDTEDTKGGSP